MPVLSTISPAATPLARILAHEAAYWSCISAVERRDGWNLYHNTSLRPRLDPNHASDFRAAGGTGDAIAREIVAFYEALGAAALAIVDVLATPRDLADCLVRAGFREWPGATSDLLLYVGPDEGRPEAHDVEVVDTDATREEWAAAVEEGADAAAREVLRRRYLAEIADPRVTPYLARVEGRAVARGELFSCDGLGRVEAIRTLAPYRGRGLAAAIVRRAVRDSLARGDALTYLYAEPGGVAARLYTRLGFRLVTPRAARAFLRDASR
ncbi:MAG: hypothetical protein AVDCRST_MAG88-2323 [uncultured Thermomicrobiales bacterium]|uniref:N-acetyltransferase domain-containing protein n=1 Tax=uncultured Thermomicrobiales bacterium TaxID=1645740 RepID=A0A6J4V6P7_9BACT|nr:MAG: hypothetical protein AVDCRST_MAG88-2323 [uncultured Thermomicrobiales bacterium]